MIPIDDDLENCRLRAAEFLGWRGIRYSSSGLLIGYPPGAKGKNSYQRVPSYSRDAGAALEILQFINSFNLPWRIEGRLLGDRVWLQRVEIGPQEVPIASAVHKNIALAICMALEQLPDDIRKAICDGEEPVLACNTAKKSNS